MKIAHIYGDGDMAVLYVEQEIGLKAAIQDTLNSSAKMSEYTDDMSHAIVEIKEFEGEVDPRFINFIKNQIMDYDLAKNEDFFVFEEKEGEIRIV